MHEHDQPWRAPPVHTRECRVQPGALQGARVRWGVGIERYHVGGAELPRPVGVVRAPARRRGVAPPGVVGDPGLRVPHLVVAAAREERHAGSEGLHECAKGVPPGVVAVGVGEVAGEEHRVGRRGEEGAHGRVGRCCLAQIGDEAERDGRPRLGRWGHGKEVGARVVGHAVVHPCAVLEARERRVVEHRRAVIGLGVLVVLEPPAHLGRVGKGRAALRPRGCVGNGDEVQLRQRGETDSRVRHLPGEGHEL
mmetsp:Transcript_15560/g.45487  ORF Transcript_15560/g.45487 Transcript_15560/m.45487 type:complete len:251 (+) Transcript_15560:555-1307(+)